MVLVATIAANKGFATGWCKLIESFMQGGSVGVKLNDDNGHYFQTKKKVSGRVTHYLQCFLIL
jgi:hypothetical protein